MSQPMTGPQMGEIKPKPLVRNLMENERESYEDEVSKFFLDNAPFGNEKISDFLKRVNSRRVVGDDFTSTFMDQVKKLIVRARKVDDDDDYKLFHNLLGAYDLYEFHSSGVENSKIEMAKVNGDQILKIMLRNK